MQNLIYLTLIFSIIIILSLGLYPIIAWLRSLIVRREVAKSDDFVRPVSIIIAAHNEEKHIGKKLDSFLDAEELIDGSEIIVVSNASTDSTDSILSSYSENPRVKIYIEKENASKILAVNRAVKEAKHELVIFSDCRQQMKRGSVKSLVRNFHDPEVGTVNSTLTDAGGLKKMSLRNLLNLISEWESLSGSSLNVYGALYAQRKSVFREFPEDILFDDLFVVVSTILQKKRLITEKNAVIYDVPFNDYYKSDRIDRLARGLLLFLTRHFKMIRCMPFNYFLRFMIFKYFKLVLPFMLLFLFPGIIYFFINNNTPPYWLIPLLAFLGMLIFKPVRQFIIQFIQINLHFFKAILQFLFLKKRSNKWGKLGV